MSNSCSRTGTLLAAALLAFTGSLTAADEAPGKTLPTASVSDSKSEVANLKAQQAGIWIFRKYILTKLGQHRAPSCEIRGWRILSAFPERVRGPGFDPYFGGPLHFRKGRRTSAISVIISYRVANGRVRNPRF